MSWKNEIDKAHKGQTGFFKTIEPKQITMKVYILKQGERNIKGFECYDYAAIEKAKYQHANPTEKYHIEDLEILEGDIEVKQVSTDAVVLENENCETIGVVEVEADLYEGAKPSYMVGDKIIEEYYHEWKLESATIFGDSVEALGVSEELTRWINNEVDNCIYELNEE